MRTLLYNSILFFTRLLIPVIASINPKLKLFYTGRKKWAVNVGKALSGNTRPIVWMHCSSVGEFEQGLPVLELLKKEHPEWKALVTFFSPSGYEAVNNPIIDYKFYLPLDTATNARKFMDLIDPKLALFVKYEFWFHFLNELKRKKIPTFSVSSIFRPSQIFFRPMGAWNRKMLRAFTYFMVQDAQSLKLLNNIGVSNASVTGDTRFDRVVKIKEDTARFPEIENFVKKQDVFIVGSLRPEDDETVLSFVKANPHLKFIIAPHEITEKNMLKVEQTLGNCVRHSQLEEKDNDKQVLIIDSIGKLSRLYRLANFAYVGGGFSDGIHNILEPAVYNLPVFFGNKFYRKYKEANDLVEIGGAFPVANANQIIELLLRLKNENHLNETKSKIEHYVNSNLGAAERVVEQINKWMQA